MTVEQAILPTLHPLEPQSAARSTAACASDRAQQEDNKLRFTDRTGHRWYRFVLSYPPHLVRNYVAKFGLGARHRVLDPFCGTGTTLVECKKLGIDSIGIDANPACVLASRVKTNWDLDLRCIEQLSQQVVASASPVAVYRSAEDVPCSMHRGDRRERSLWPGDLCREGQWQS